LNVFGVIIRHVERTTYGHIMHVCISKKKNMRAPIVTIRRATPDTLIATLELNIHNYFFYFYFFSIFFYVRPHDIRAKV
jgi:hypothetical protein